jgi:hypothetical protein
MAIFPLISMPTVSQTAPTCVVLAFVSESVKVFDPPVPHVDILRLDIPADAQSMKDWDSVSLVGSGIAVDNVLL